MAKHRKHRNYSSPWSVIAGISLMIIVAVALVSGGYFYIDQKEKRPVLSKEDFCPLGEAPHHVTVLVVDASDPLNKVQKLSLNNLVDKLVKEEVPRYGAFVIYAVNTDESYRSKPVFYRCNPGYSEDDGNTIDKIFENPKKIKRQWREGFRVPLDKELNRNLESGSASSSPIMQSIQWAVVEQFQAPDRANVPHRLVIVSDFLQHTKEYSHYRTKPDFSIFEDSNYYRHVRTNLLGVDVSLWFIRRESSTSSESLERFWESYFRVQGSNKVQINHLAG